MADHVSYRLLLILSQSRQLLGVPTREGVSLAQVSVPRWMRQAEQLANAIAANWQLNVIILDVLPGDLSSEACAVVEVRPDNSSAALSHFVTVDPMGLSDTELTANERDVLDSTLSAQPRLRGPFSRIGWIDEAQEWIQKAIQERHVSFTGDIRQLNASATFALVRFETDDASAYWLKATGEPNTREFGITMALSAWFPQYLPPLIAARKDWNAWVTKEVGRPLSDSLGLTELEQATRTMASFQIASTARIDELIALGCPDCRTPMIAQKIEEIFDYLDEVMKRQVSTKVSPIQTLRLREIKSILLDACSSMGSIEVPDTLFHNDLNFGNLLIDRERCLLIDLCEISVGNPFHTVEYLSAQLKRDVNQRTWVHRIRSCYRDAWLPYLGNDRLDRALVLAPLLSIATYLYGSGAWLQSSYRNNPVFQSYARSLARHMDRAAQAPELMEALCQ